MPFLDALDKKLLSEFGANSRRSLSDISRSLRQSRERIEYRTERLLSTGIIEYFGATFNPQRLGFQIYKTYLRLETNQPRVSALLKHLKGHPRMSWLATCDGGWDVVFCLYARTAEEFHAMHVDLLSDFDSIVLDFSSYCLTSVKMYRRKYLVKGSAPSFVSLAGAYSQVEVSELDWKIMRVIHSDARLAMTEIAKAVDSTPSIVRSHIEQLERAEILTGYGVELNIQKLGMLFFKTQFFFGSYQKEQRHAFEKFCDRHPAITCFTEQIGDCNLEVEMHVHDYDEYYKVLEDIRIKFAKLLRNFTTIIIRKADYYWLPRVL